MSDPEHPTCPECLRVLSPRLSTDAKTFEILESQAAEILRLEARIHELAQGAPPVWPEGEPGV